MTDTIRFDLIAREWDKNPLHFKRSEAIASAFLANANLSNYNTAMEFGAGTGILSILLKDCFKEIIMLDNSKEMISVLQEKLKNENITHLKPWLYNLETDGIPALHTDVIFTQMALHHVADIEKILSQFHTILNTGGLLAIADLYTEDGSFHDQDFDGHYGFDPDALKKILEFHGFSHIKHQSCFTIQKPNADGSSKDFPIFLLTCIKK